MTDLDLLTTMCDLRTNWRRWFAAAALAFALSVVGGVLHSVYSRPILGRTEVERAAVSPSHCVASGQDGRAMFLRRCVWWATTCDCVKHFGPAAPYAIWGVDSAAARCGGGEVGWDARGMIPWQEFAQGEYVGQARTPHVPEYRLREGDQVAVYYRRTRDELSRPYELQVGDRLRVESITAGSGTSVDARTGGVGAETTSDDIARELVVQPDGTITLPLLGQVRATRRTVAALRDELEERVQEVFPRPVDHRDADRRQHAARGLAQHGRQPGRQLGGGLQVQVKVTPAGDIQLPGIDSVFVQGLTLGRGPAGDRCAVRRGGAGRAGHDGPRGTGKAVRLRARRSGAAGAVRTRRRRRRSIQASSHGRRLEAGLEFAASGGVSSRRDWRLMATMLDLRGALYGRRPVPADDIWLNDSDIVLVTKTPIQQADELIEQVFTRGLYSVVPREVLWNVNLASGSSL